MKLWFSDNACTTPYDLNKDPLEDCIVLGEVLWGLFSVLLEPRVCFPTMLRAFAILILGDFRFVHDTRLVSMCYRTPINANSICLCTSSLQTSSVVEQDSQALVQQSSRDGSALDTNTALLSDAGLRFFLQTDRDFEKMYIPRDEQSES